MNLPAGATAKNVRFLSRCDQGGRPDGVQVILHKGHAFIGHMFSDGFSVVDVRDPLNPKTVSFRGRAEEHPLASFADPRRHSACGQWPEHLGHAAICQPSRLLRQVAGGFGADRAAFRRGRARVRYLAAGRTARDRLSAYAGLRRPPHLVGRRALRICLRAFRGLHRPYAGDRRCIGARETHARRTLVAARHASRRRREAARLVRQAHGAASHDHRRQRRLCRMA